METLTPKDTIASGNEVIAEFMGGFIAMNTIKSNPLWSFKDNIEFCSAIMIQTQDGEYLFHSNELLFDKSFDWLMPVWYKFRDLKFVDGGSREYKHHCFKTSIGIAILEKGVEPAFKELVKGITWYNSIKS